MLGVVVPLAGCQGRAGADREMMGGSDWCDQLLFFKIEKAVFPTKGCCQRHLFKSFDPEREFFSSFLFKKKGKQGRYDSEYNNSLASQSESFFFDFNNLFPLRFPAWGED